MGSDRQCGFAMWESGKLIPGWRLWLGEMLGCEEFSFNPFFSLRARNGSSRVGSLRVALKWPLAAAVVGGCLILVLLYSA